MYFDTTAQFTLFTLIMMRMSGFILLNPVLGRRNIPPLVKAGFVFILTITIYTFSASPTFPQMQPLEYGVLLLKEFLVGIVIGYVMELFFFVLTFAGYIVDFQMGLSMATVYDPQSNSQVALSGNIFFVFFMLLFFAADGHLVLMKMILYSAEVVPFGEVAITVKLSEAVVQLFLLCVELAVKFAFPILAAEFLIEIGVGVLNKIVPQISIFIINIQLKIIVGIFLLLFFTSPIFDFLNRVMDEMLAQLQAILSYF